jgi:uncharacterized protein DUF3309
MNVGTLLIVLLILALILTLPMWPYSRRWGWGWGPTGLLGFLVVATLVLMVLGIVPRP